MQTIMPEQEAQGPAAGADSLANRAKEIQQVEKRLVRDLKTCIDATNKLLERIGKAADQRDDSTPGEIPLEPG